MRFLTTPLMRCGRLERQFAGQESPKDAITWYSSTCPPPHSPLHILGTLLPVGTCSQFFSEREPLSVLGVRAVLRLGTRGFSRLPWRPSTSTSGSNPSRKKRLVLPHWGPSKGGAILSRVSWESSLDQGETLKREAAMPTPLCTCLIV